jgi:hypothetical protein
MGLECVKCKRELKFNTNYFPETADCECGAKYRRKPGAVNMYIQRGDDFLCTVCGEKIMAAEVAHSIHDGPFPLSGSGRVQYEAVPYCPKCEKEPSFHGMPIKREYGDF